MIILLLKNKYLKHFTIYISSDIIELMNINIFVSTKQ